MHRGTVPFDRQLARAQIAIGRRFGPGMVCPPHAALDVAAQVAGTGYAGIYVDANAVSVGTAEQVAGIVTAAGASYVDGGIIGPPPEIAGHTRLYLSGPRASEGRVLFGRSALDARIADGQLYAASAVKMAYAAWTKGSSALLLAARAPPRWADQRKGMARRGGKCGMSTGRAELAR
jgi:hypothetical protein